MTTRIGRTTKLRRSLAAAAALTLPFGVAACGDDGDNGNDDPDVINEDQIDDEIQDGVDDTEQQLEEGADELEEQTDELQEELDDDESPSE